MMTEFKHVWDLVGLLGQFPWELALFVAAGAIYWMSHRHQATQDTVIRNYEELSRQHLAAFEQINERNAQLFKETNERNATVFREMMESYRQHSLEMRDAVLMNVRVNTRLTEKIESLDRRMDR